jgi:hypothetical protein
VAKPGALPLGIAARLGLGLGDSRVERGLAAKRGGKLLNADGLHCREVGIKTARQQRSDFFDGACPNHALEALLDPAMERLTFRLDDEGQANISSPARSGGDCGSFCHSLSGRPVASSTSSAR